MPILLRISIYVSSFLLGAFFAFHISSLQAATSHIVISEVQIGGQDSQYNEFVEFYNPTDNDINLANWRLTRKTMSGVESNLIATFGYY